MNKIDTVLFKILAKLEQSQSSKLTKKKLTDSMPRKTITAKDWDPALEKGVKKGWITKEVIAPLTGKARPTTIYSITKAGEKELKKKLDEYNVQRREAL